VSAARPPTRAAARPPAALQTTTDNDESTTDASEQNHTSPLGGPVVTIYTVDLVTPVQFNSVQFVRCERDFTGPDRPLAQNWLWQTPCATSSVPGWKDEGCAALTILHANVTRSARQSGERLAAAAERSRDALCNRDTRSQKTREAPCALVAWMIHLVFLQYNTAQIYIAPKIVSESEALPRSEPCQLL